MRSEDAVFVGGPMHGRVLPVLLGVHGRPPRHYEIPVPAASGGPPTVYVYRLQPAHVSPKLGLPRGWRYVHEPDGRPGLRVRARLPWGRGKGS